MVLLVVVTIVSRENREVHWARPPLAFTQLSSQPNASDPPGKGAIVLAAQVRLDQIGEQFVADLTLDVG